MGDHNVQAMVMVAWQEGIHHVLVPHVAHQQAHQQAHHQGHQLATGAMQALQPYQSTNQPEAQEQDLEGSAVQAQVSNGAEEETEEDGEDVDPNAGRFVRYQFTPQVISEI